MAVCVLRIGKLKAGDVKSAQQHNDREFETSYSPNINFDETSTNQKLIGNGELAKDLARRLEKTTNKRSLRKDANVALEFIFSASPEYFYKDLDREKFDKLTMKDNGVELAVIKMTLDPQKLEAWKKTVLQYAKEQFGDNCIDLTLHLDEKTPHFHAIVVPIMPDGRLSAKDYFKPETCRKFQDTYGVACKPLGIKRGEEFSPAIHTNQYEHAAKQVLIDKPPAHKIPSVEKPGFLTPASKVYEQAKERDNALMEKYDFYKKFYNEHESDIRYSQVLKSENATLFHKVARANLENSYLKKTVKDLRAEDFENMKLISCVDVCKELGLKIAISENKQKIDVETSADKISIDVQQNSFTATSKLDKLKQKGAGAIDLLHNVFDYTVAETIQFLKSKFDAYSVSQLLKTDKQFSQVAIEFAVKYTSVNSKELASKQSALQLPKQTQTPQILVNRVVEKPTQQPAQAPRLKSTFSQGM
ncbi:MAG: MobV family relaxase [Polaromonas sp.]|nr:MobV family relaxase [Polaromonas sp.]